MATNPALTRQASRRRDDPVVTGLVTRARNGERQAWDAPVERYAPLIWSICRRHRLEAADAPGRRPERLAQARGPARQNPRPGRAARLAGHHHPARMRPHPAHRAATLRRRVCAGRRDHPRTITPRRPSRTCSRPNGTRPCARRSGSCPPAASSCSPCSSTILRCRTPRSAPGWASRPAASGPPAAAAWTSYAATRPSARWSMPAPRPPRHMHSRSERESSSLLCYAFLADPAIQGSGLAITARTRRIPSSGGG